MVMYVQAWDTDVCLGNHLVLCKAQTRAPRCTANGSANDGNGTIQLEVR